MEIFGLYFIVYLMGIVLYMIAILICNAVSTKYSKFIVVTFFPLTFFLLFNDLRIFINNYLTQNNLKQMNFKILSKAMGFMFLPTFGVLTMLLVGFFDPIAMWNFIKSNDGWAITIRIFIFIAEVSLITTMYFQYLKEDIKKQFMTGETPVKSSRNVDSYTDVKDLFNNRNSNDKYIGHSTENKNLILIERKSGE